MIFILLLLLFFIVGIACWAIYLIIKKPFQKKPPIFAKWKNKDSKKKHARKTVPMDLAYSSQSEQLWQEIKIRWPEMFVMMERIPMQSTFFMHWKGAVRHSKSILFIFHQEEAFHAFMEACEVISEQNLLPYNDFYVAYTYGKQFGELQNDVLAWMYRTEKYFEGALSDDSELMNLSGAKGIQAIIGVGYRPYYKYEVKGDTSEFDWKGGLNVSQLFPIRESAISAIWQSTFLDSYFRKKNASDLIARIPEAKSIFYSELIRTENNLFLFGVDQNDLMENESILIQSARKSHVILKRTEQMKESIQTDIHDCLYLHTVQSAQRSICDICLPVVLTKESQQCLSFGCPIVHFTPLLNHTRVSSEASNAFYFDFLLR